MGYADSERGHRTPEPAMMTDPTRREDYDSPWKTLLEHYFQAFLEWFFPAVAADVDWGRSFEFLDKELQKVTRQAALGRRYADKLVKVWRRSGEETWVLVHVEIQAQPETAFAERMFVYYYRLFDRYRLPLASLAVLADEQADWRPAGYWQQLWGCRAGLEFPAVKLLDYQGREGELAASGNPFALAVEAHLAARATHGDPPRRLAYKLALTRRLYRRGLNRQDVVNLYAFVDWLLVLPEALEVAYLEEIQHLEEETKMRYVTSAERIGIRKGIERGRQEGRQEGQRELLEQLLAARFGRLPEWVAGKLVAAEPARLAGWARRVLTAESLEAVFAEAK
jgi:hypothetical protein